jgi:hypothetical protein
MRIALNCKIISYGNGCLNMRPVRIQRRMSGWCGIHNTSTVTYIECEEAFSSELYARNKGATVLASEHNVGLLVDHVLDHPAFD